MAVKVQFTHTLGTLDEFVFSPSSVLKAVACSF